METVELISSWKQEEQLIQLIEKYIVDMATNRYQLQILEAGCGRNWPLNLSEIQYTLTGIDLDKNALDARKSVFDDLDNIIIGDLRSVELENNKYDVIYNSFVLEHIDNAELVLDKFNTWLKPGGLLIIRIPDCNSVYGFITRITPHWFHVFYYKLRGFHNAGKPGFGPYPTFYNSIVSRSGIKDYCKKNELKIKGEFAQDHYLEGSGLTTALIKLFAQSISILSIGKLAWKHNNLTYILEKKHSVASQ